MTKVFVEQPRLHPQVGDTHICFQGYSFASTFCMDFCHTLLLCPAPGHQGRLVIGSLRGATVLLMQVTNNCRGSAYKNVLYFKCPRKYHTGSATGNTNLNIFCSSCLQLGFCYNISKCTCFRVYFQHNLDSFT